MGELVSTNLETGEQPQVSSDLVRGRSEACKGCKSIDIDFPGVGLGSDGVCVAESRELCDELVELLNLHPKDRMQRYQMLYFIRGGV